MFAIFATQLTAEGTVSIRINRCGPLRRCPRGILWDNNLQCSARRVRTDKLLGAREVATRCYPPRTANGVCPGGHGGVEKISLTTAQTLIIVANERQDDCGGEGLCTRAETCLRRVLRWRQHVLPPKRFLGDGTPQPVGTKSPERRSFLFCKNGCFCVPGERVLFVRRIELPVCSKLFFGSGIYKKK